MSEHTSGVLERGVYEIMNKRSGTVLDLRKKDDCTINGWARHGGPNQRVSFFDIGILRAAPFPFSVVEGQRPRQQRKPDNYVLQQTSNISCAWR